MRPALRGARGAATAALAALALTVSGCAAGPAGTPAPHSSARPGPVWNTRPASVAALGDSITRGFDACALLSDCPQVSWATGSRREVDSLAERLGARSWNLAVSGARMADLPAQAARAAARHPQLVTVEMGANDACRPDTADMTSPARFRTEFTAAMDTLRRDSPATEVYVASVPDLERLWSVGHASAMAEQVWNLGICPSMLAHPASLSLTDTARRTAVETRVTQYNRVLAQVCARYERCRYDDGAVFGNPFDAGALSPWDWFHPSAQGQARLARLAYAGVTRR